MTKQETSRSAEMRDATPTPEDEQAVGELMLTLAAAFKDSDASGIEDLYSSDADWTNAFGTSRRGAAAISAYLTKLFADRHFADGRPVGPPQASFRFITPDVCVVKTYVAREGQQTSAGDPLPTRRNHSLKVLRRDAAGWKIISDMYMDARQDQTFAGFADA